MSAEILTHHFFGERLQQQALTIGAVRRFFNERVLGEKLDAFRRKPIDRIIAVLDEVGDSLTDPSKPYLSQILERMPDVANYSPKMVAESVQQLRGLLSCESLVRRLACLGDYHCLDTFVGAPDARLLRAVPLGSVCHIAAGNVFLGSIDSLIYGLLTKNVNVLKCSSQDPVFPFLFFDALREVDTDGVVYPYCALTYWSHGNEQIGGLVKQVFDAILLFGGEEAVREYKQGLSPKTQLLSYGPKISFGVVCRGLSEQALRETARGFALDVVMWEQRACTSCQNIFFERDEKLGAERFAEYLAEALERYAIEYPQGKITLDEGVEIRKERELAAWKQFCEEGGLWEGRDAHHTVILQRSADIIPSPLNRTVYVNEVENIGDLLDGNLGMMAYYMSTVGLATPEAELQSITERLLPLGVLRFCKPGNMGLAGDSEAPHDGAHLPLQLVRLISPDDLPRKAFGFDRTEKSLQSELLLARLNSCIKNALQSPFYSDFYSKVRLPLRSIEESALLPILEKAHLREHSAHKSTAMLTGPPGGAYIFSEGGTTGPMLYLYYTSEEFAVSARYFGEGFRMAGLGPEDMVANLMRAGAFWTAFMATNLGLQETGCRILSITFNQTARETLDYLRLLKPTAVMGLPSVLYQLAQLAEEQDWKEPIRKILYAGEHLTAGSREYIERVFAPSRIASLGYAAVETGPIGYQCEHCSGTEHHIFHDLAMVELDETSDVLITVLKRRLQPIIRYRLADMGVWVNEPCACGRPGRKLRLLSRSSDYVRVNYEDITVNEVAEALRPFPELSGFFQIIVEPAQERTRVGFVVETLHDDAAVGDSALEKRALQAIFDGCNWFRVPFCQELARTSQVEFGIELVPPQTIPRVGRTGKIRRIVDHRMG